MKKFFFFAFFFASCIFTINAQSKSELQIGLAMPQGDFADDNFTDAILGGSGVATTGFYLGYKLLSPLKYDGLYWTINAGIMYNDLQRDYKDVYGELLGIWGDYNYSLPKYFNVPILAGLQYEKSLSDGLKLFGEAGVGLNILKLTNLSASDNISQTSMSFKPSLSIGYKIGAGIVLQDKYTISVNYLGLGSHKVKYLYEIKAISDEFNYSVSEDVKFQNALSVSSLNIMVGIRF